MAEKRLFCYGLLMLGEQYHESHVAECTRKIEPAKTTGRLLYLDATNCPAFMPGEEEVIGELLTIDDSCFPRLDYLFGIIENHPEKSEFVRREISVITNDGKTETAYVHALRAQVLRERFPGAYEIEDGNWRKFSQWLKEEAQKEQARNIRKKYPSV